MDIDVAVVGAGPAGLAAALRVRWVKSHRAVPCSVVVFDPAPRPGGLATVGATRLTGPSVQPILGSVLDDLCQLEIPVEQQAVERIEPAGSGWQVRTANGGEWRARAVVLATGLRRLTNELDFFGKGYALAHNGYDYIPEYLARLVRDGVSHLVVISNEKAVNLLPALAPLQRQGLRITLLLETPREAAPAHIPAGVVVRFGRLAGLHGKRGVEKMQFTNETGDVETLDCDLVFMDYAAFELKPEQSLTMPGLERDVSGRVLAGRGGATSVPGVFAAGDAVGEYAMAVKAYSEGSLAGFSAYRHVFHQKFGYAPSLFAYAAEDRPMAPGNNDYPVLRADDRVEILGPAEAVRQAAAACGLDAETLFRLPAGFAEWEVALGPDAARTLVYALFDTKACTIQPETEEPREPACRT